MQLYLNYKPNTVLTPYYHAGNTGGPNSAGVEIMGGLYNLTLPSNVFANKGIYTVYIRPARNKN